MNQNLEIQIQEYIKKHFPPAYQISESVPIYLLGGGIRDLMLAQTPKDLDFLILGQEHLDFILTIFKELHIEYTFNSFGGFKFNYHGTIIDLWLTDDLYSGIQYNVDGLFFNLQTNSLISLTFDDFKKHGLRLIKEESIVDEKRKMKLKEFEKRFLEGKTNMNTISLMYCYKDKPKEERYKSYYERYMYAAKRDDTCYYDQSTDSFYNPNGTEIDIKRKRILPLVYIEDMIPVIHAIERKGGIPVNDLEQIERIKSWNQEIHTERVLFHVTGKDLLENETIKKKLIDISAETGEFFLKTKEKDFSGTIPIHELLDPFYGLIPALQLHQEEEFVVGEAVSVLKDSLGNLEYRCIVIDGKILNISRNLFLTYHYIPDFVRVQAEKLLERIKRIKDFPTTFCLDMMCYEVANTDTVIVDITELNPLEATGEYLYNSVYPLLSKESEEDNKEMMTRNDSIRSRMVDTVPTYKQGMNASFEKHEPQRVYKQSYYKNGFSYHYGCSKKFGNPEMSRFYIHNYYELGGGESMDIVDFLNENIPLKRLKEGGLYQNLKCIDIHIDKNVLEERIALEEKEKEKRKSIE